MINLCYKEYPFKVSLGACKSFFDKTGLDLQSVLMKYIISYTKTKDMTLIERLSTLSELYPRDVANKLLHCLIVTENTAIPFCEVDDATYRVGWLPSDRSDDLSEPWCLVMVDVAMQVNTYFNDNMPKKKADIEVST